MERYSDLDLDDPRIVSILDDLPLWSAPFGLRLLETVEYRRGLQVLDLGSGTGFPLATLAARLGRGCRVTGLDPWLGAARRGRQRIAVTKLANAAVVAGRGEDLPFREAVFDLIVSNNGINNVDDAGRVLGECARVARPGAQFVVTVNLPGTMSVFYDRFRETVRELGLEDAVAAIDAHIHRHRRHAGETVALLEEAGFRVGECRRDSFTMRYLDGGALFGDFFIQLAFAGPWRDVVAAGRQEEVFSRLEENLDRYAARAGELALEIPFVCIDARRR